MLLDIVENPNLGAKVMAHGTIGKEQDSSTGNKKDRRHKKKEDILVWPINLR